MKEKVINTLFKALGSHINIIKISKNNINFSYLEKGFRVFFNSSYIVKVSNLGSNYDIELCSNIEKTLNDYLLLNYKYNNEDGWLDVVGYEGLYKVNSNGDVKSINYNRTGQSKLLKCAIDRYGYYIVNLYKNQKRKTFRVHRIVAQAFMPNDDANNTLINHKDENKLNNRVENLEWCNAKYNINYSIRKYKGVNPKKIIQMDMNEIVVQEWDSISKAANSLGYSKSSISNCCRGKIKSYKNFLWKFL